MGISFRNFTLPINEELILLFLIIIGISYYIFFGKHHKKNEMTFNEIFPLVINYLALSIISFFLLVFGIDTVLTGYVYNEQVSEVIKELIIGCTIISLVILNFVFYVKKHRVDLVQAEREEKEEREAKIGEIVEIIIFSLMIIAPIFNIFNYIHFLDKVEKYRQIGGSILCIFTAIFLLYNLNPLDIKNKIKSIFKKK